MEIPLLDLTAQYESLSEELDEAVRAIVRSHHRNPAARGSLATDVTVSFEWRFVKGGVCVRAAWYTVDTHRTNTGWTRRRT